MSDLTNTNQIDFLPASYREVSSKRKISLWRLLVIALFGGTIVAAAGYQYRLHGQVERQLLNVDAQFLAAQAETARLAETQAKLQPVRATAELLTYLRHPWPRTQILNAVVSALPVEITLDELHISRDKSERSQSKEEVSRPSTETPINDKQPPSGKDLQRLRAELDYTRVVVSIHGVTTDPAALHVYLAKLNRNPLFTKVTLGAIEGSRDAERPGDKFSARIIVRPGYGQPGGPEPKSEMPAVAPALTANEGAK